MKVALSFPNEQMSYWQERLRETLADLLSEAAWLLCTTLADLRAAAPEIIIGQESPELIAYLRERPIQLRWVQFMSAGLDKTLAELGGEPVPFQITNMRGIHANAMAEYALAAVLHFEKRIDYFIESKALGRWSRPSLRQLGSKRLLVCGAGAIGQRAGEVFCALGSEVDAIARSPSPRPPFAEVFTLSDLPEIVDRYDYIFCALPLTRETCGVFSWGIISAMKPGAIFVNIARGEMVDDDALRDALTSGHLGGAALDAFTTEPLPADSPLWRTPRLLITPHVSGRFEKGHELGLEVVRRNISAYLAGEPLLTEVFPERGY